MLLKNKASATTTDHGIDQPTKVLAQWLKAEGLSLSTRDNHVDNSVQRLYDAAKCLIYKVNACAAQKQGTFASRSCRVKCLSTVAFYSLIDSW